MQSVYARSPNETWKTSAALNAKIDFGWRCPCFELRAPWSSERRIFAPWFHRRQTVICLFCCPKTHLSSGNDDAHDATDATCLAIYIGFLTHGWSCVSGKQKKNTKKQNFSVSDIRSSFGCFALHTIHGVLYTHIRYCHSAKQEPV